MKYLSRIKSLLTEYSIGYLIPTIVMGFYFSLLSLNQPLHDFANNYFPALLAVENISPETVLFDIFEFNQYAWSKGYESVIADFYLNSPFTSTLFYPFAWIKNAYYSKLLFNLISVLFFTMSLQLFSKKYLSNNNRFLLLTIPFLFFIPIRNNIEFGQVYILLISLILLGYYYIDSNKKIAGELFLSLSILIKVFPLIYCIPLLISKKWKSIMTIFICTLILVSISIPISGSSFWSSYLFEVMPNAINNESTVNFQSNSQSFTVFLKTLFVHDSYYNPEALFNSPTLYRLLSWLFSAFFISIAITTSFQYRKQQFRLLSIWIVVLFLIQSRTATYAQILWLIPAFEIFRGQFSKISKITAFLLLLLICNSPFHWMSELPLFFKFTRMWLSIAFGLMLLIQFKVRLDHTLLKVFLLIFIPFLILLLTKKQNIEESDYVLSKKEYFLIHNFYAKDNHLVYEAIGKNGNEIVHSNIPIEKFDTSACKIEEGQIMYGNQKLTDSYSIKKKPILVNDNLIYYLSDHHSRRGAYTLRQIAIPQKK